MLNHLFLFQLVFIIFLSTGCAAGRSDFARMNPSVHYPPKSANEIVHMTTMGSERSYEEIGFLHISAKKRDGYDMLQEKLRMEARRVGADAVIYVTYGTENAFSIAPIFIAIPYDVLFVEGLAIRYKD